MFARVTLRFDTRAHALVVPEEAIVPQGSSPYVLTVVPGQKDGSLIAQRVPVLLGLRTQGLVEVQDGLALDDRVVTAGQQRVQRDGAPVRVVDLPQAPASAASE
jgi:membrane fusion protein (multidrug efflux system)